MCPIYILLGSAVFTVLNKERIRIFGSVNERERLDNQHALSTGQSIGFHQQK